MLFIPAFNGGYSAVFFTLDFLKAGEVFSIPFRSEQQVDALQVPWFQEASGPLKQHVLITRWGSSRKALETPGSNQKANPAAEWRPRILTPPLIVVTVCWGSEMRSMCGRGVARATQPGRKMHGRRCLEMEQPIYANSAKSAANPVMARVGDVRVEHRLAVGVATKQKTKQTGTKKKRN